MKFFNAISKNFKVLFRQKTALLSIILGPLLIIFLIGLAFNSSSSIDMTIGYHSPDNSSLTEDFVTMLEENDYTLKSYPSNKTCINKLKDGLVHTCIIFPENFKIEKNSQKSIEFHVDKSRMNIVYKVIDRVSKHLESETDELSMNLTERLTSTMDASSAEVDNALAKVIKIKKSVSDTSETAATTENNLDELDFSADNASLDMTKDLSSIETLNNEISEEVGNTVSEGHTLISSIEDKNPNSNISSDLDDLGNKLDDLNETVNTKKQTSNTKISDIVTEVQETSSQIDSLKSKLSKAEDTTSDSIKKLDNIQSDLSSISDDLDTVKKKLEQASATLENVKITSSQQIVNPINTEIKTISSNNKISMLFPYVLILIIMFVGLLLSSTLVVVEKKSKAAFRVFTTPTRDEFFIITTFVTSFIIILFQILIILGAVSLFGVDPISQNLAVNAVLLILGSAIFIMLGMCLGYLLPTQQSSNMASISLGAIFLFLSNLVLPVESISPYLQKVAEFNPYVLSSETLRQSILFSLGFEKIGGELAILFGYSIIIFILIIVVQKVSKMRFLKNSSHLKHDKIFKRKELWIKNTRIKSEKELILALKHLDEEGYKEFVRKNTKALKRFISEELEQPSTAKNIKNYSRTELLKQFVKKNENIITKLKKQDGSEKSKNTKKKK